MKLSGRKGGFDLDQVPTLKSKEVIEILIFSWLDLCVVLALKFVPMKHVPLNITSYSHRGFFYALRELQKDGENVGILTGLLSFLMEHYNVIRLEIATLPDQAHTY